MLSVVIPFLSGLADLKRCISSVKRQSPKAEIIVVNDSVKKLSLGDGVRVIDNDKNMGAAFSRNAGFSRSKGEFVLFADSDVVLRPGCISRLVSKMSSCDIAFPKTILESGALMHPIEQEKDFPQISTCFLLKRSSAAAMDELFDENYRIYLEDSDFFLRANLFGLKSCYVPSAVVIHRLKSGFSKDRLFMDSKNLFYGLIKFSFIGKSEIYHPFRLRFVFSNFLCAVFNFDKFDRTHYDTDSSALRKALLLLRPHKKLGRSRAALLLEFFRAKLWVLENLHLAIRKRCLLVRRLKH